LMFPVFSLSFLPLLPPSLIQPQDDRIIITTNRYYFCG
jgi:hypothetical protein